MQTQGQRLKLVTGHAESGNMKASEFITEGKPPPKRYREATRGLHTFGNDYSTYDMYRLMLAVACSNGYNELPDHVVPENWIGLNGVSIPLSHVEHQMLLKAYKKLGIDARDLNNGDLRSMELKMVNKTSPVAKPKKNKYGV